MSDQNAVSNPAPIIDMAGLHEIANGVWIIPDQYRIPLVPNLGIIEGERSVLVVDTGMGRENARKVLDKAREIAKGRPLFLTLTHFHPEHGFGHQVFAGEATILYNRRQRDELRAKGPGYLDMFRGFGEHVAKCLVDVQFVDPDLVYDGRLTMELGGRAVELIEMGPAHSMGDQVVWLPEERVVFVGDLVETGVFPIVPFFPPDDADVNGNKWIRVLRRIAALGPKTVVTGHGDIGGIELIQIAERYLTDMGRQVAALKGSGVPEDDVVATLEPVIRGRHPDWREPNWVESGIRCFYATGYDADAVETAQ